MQSRISKTGSLGVAPSGFATAMGPESTTGFVYLEWDECITYIFRSMETRDLELDLDLDTCQEI